MQNKDIRILVTQGSLQMVCGGLPMMYRVIKYGLGRDIGIPRSLGSLVSERLQMPQIWIHQQIKNWIPLISKELNEEIMIPNKDVKNLSWW